MSIRLMSIVWEINFPTQSQKLIALKLADFASDSGSSVFPSVNTIARHTGCDERTVQRVMRALRECGLISLEKEGGTGPRATNHWQLNILALTSIAYKGWTLSGGAHELKIDPGVKGDILSDKGDILSADDLLRVTPVSAKGGILSAKGDTGVTQSTNNHQELPLRAGAHATQSAARPSLLVRKSDSSWLPWLDKIEASQGAEARAVVEAEGSIRVAARWPTDVTPIPKVAVPRAGEQAA